MTYLYNNLDYYFSNRFLIIVLSAIFFFFQSECKWKTDTPDMYLGIIIFFLRLNFYYYEHFICVLRFCKWNIRMHGYFLYRFIFP